MDQMAKLHFLNVKNGDCIIIQHNSKNVTLIDISNGNNDETEIVESSKAKTIFGENIKGNFNCCKYPTNPISYLRDKLNINTIFRFILTHPDMDHLDGLSNLMNNFNVINYWDNGLRRDKPDFQDSGGRYNEDDWDVYEDIISDKIESLTVIKPLDGYSGKYFNISHDGEYGGDGLHILSPNKKLVNQANETLDPNDGSYVILYKSGGGKIIIAGDSHDDTWEHILKNHKEEIQDVKILIAPHHGRDSDREYDFLDEMLPKYTLFGCAPSKDQGYSAWNNRGLDFNTNNQCGNFCLEIESNKIKIFIENKIFAISAGLNLEKTNDLGYYLLKTIT